MARQSNSIRKVQAMLTKILLPLAALAAISLPAAAEARHGSDDPPQHITREHHRLGHHHRHGRDDIIRHGRHGRDDGPNHR
jgi:hypothetical protein